MICSFELPVNHQGRSFHSSAACVHDKCRAKNNVEGDTNHTVQILAVDEGDIH
jgi:hypothetical protein